MSAIIGSPLLLGGDATTPSYTTQRSVRLRSSASAYLNRTLAAGSQTTWTFSLWVKRGTLSTSQILLDAVTGNYDTGIAFTSSDTIDFYVIIPTAVYHGRATTTAVFRDPSAWYHLVFVMDTTNATANDRMRIYVNGVRQTLSTNTTPTISTTNGVINSAISHTISKYAGGASNYFDGYLTEINFVDGQALLPTAFGEYNAVRNTQWQPKAYTGTYGTNGFYLKFADNSAATAAAIGKDSSGNGNNWTPNGISLTAGATYDSMTDVPTLTSDTAANFCTLNPLNKNASSITVLDGNLGISTSASNVGVTGTIGVSSGKWYWETTFTNASGIPSIGAAPATWNKTYVGEGTGGVGYHANGIIYNTGTNVQSGLASYTSGDVIGVALDMGAGSITFYKNNVQQGTTVTGLTGEWFPAVAGQTSSTLAANFGQRPFAYTPPTGFKALNTYNLPEPAVASSDDYHQVYTYTGNGGGLQVGEIQKPLSLYNLDRSLRFRASASAYLSRTFGTPTNQDKWTYSTWVKRGALGAMPLFGQGTAAGNGFNCTFQSDDSLEIYYPNTGATADLKTTRLFKDPANFYHVVIAYDLAQTTPSNRLKVYVNGVQETVFSLSTYPSASVNFNTNGGAARIGNNPIFGGFFDGYLADVYFIDGQALDPTSFGQYDGNYYWTPKAYTGTYGTNGFHLEFKDYSAATAAAIGKDTSGQGNNWTPTNINLTTPANTNASWDSMVDVPTLTSTDVANFCTLDPLRAWGATVVATLTEANQKLTSTSGAGARAFGTIGMTSGKWYWEAQWTAGASANMSSGVTKDPVSLVELIGYDANSWGYYVQASNLGAWNNGSRTVIGSAFTANSDVLGVAFDADIGSLYFYKNGTLIGSGAAFTGLTGATFYPAISANASTSIINFGQRPFAQTPPTGFKALNSFNVKEVTGDLESPDFVWIKSRSAGTNHALFNSVSGATKYLSSNTTTAETTDVNSLIQFNKNGFLLGNSAIVNTLAATYVAAALKISGTTVNNTAGGVTSQVRANPICGLSLVKWVTPATFNPLTVGHGLTKVPKLILVKSTDAANNWVVYYNQSASDTILNLNSTALASSQVGSFGVPTDTTFTQGNNTWWGGNRGFIALCVAEIPGFSKITSYAANASSTDGPHVVCGFAPRWIMIKRTTGASGTGGWIMYDTARDTYNVMSKYLFAEGAAGEGTLAAIDVTANGFKIRSNNVHLNQTAGDIYLVIAFAEHPFKYALAR